MPRVSADAAPPRTKQRTRRSHKNSKDGCPNCRAKRVKCGEELPSCLQCIRKKCRCGYLDFPPKRLEYLARKNESKREAEEEAKAAAAASAAELPSMETSTPLQPFRTELKHHETNLDGYSLYAGLQGLLLSSHLPQIQRQMYVDVSQQGHQSASPEDNSPFKTSASPMQHGMYTELDQSLYVTDNSSSLSHSHMLGPGGQSTFMRSPKNRKSGFKDQDYTSRNGAMSFSSQQNTSRSYSAHPQSLPTYLQQSPHSSFQPKDVHKQKGLHAFSMQSGTHMRHAQLHQQPTPPGHVPPYQQYQSIDPHFTPPINSFSQPLVQMNNNISKSTPMATAGSHTSHKSKPYSQSLSQSHALISPQPAVPAHSFNTQIFASSQGSTFQPKSNLPSRHNGSMIDGPLQDQSAMMLSNLLPLYFLQPTPIQTQHHKLQRSSSQNTAKYMEGANQTATFELCSTESSARNSENRSSLVKVCDRERSEEDLGHPNRPLARVRSLAYSQVFHTISLEFGQLEDVLPDDFELWADDKFLEGGDAFSAIGGDSFLSSHDTSLGKIQEVPQVKEEPSQRNTLFKQNNLLSCDLTNSELKIDNRGRMLPNGIAKVARFPKLKIPANLHKINLDHKVDRSSNTHLSEDLDYGFPYRPVWTENDSHRMWLGVFQQAATLDLYFQYFIDRSVNILVRASDAIVNGDIISFNLNLGASYSQDTQNKFFQFFYNKQDLNILTRKSYVTYGNLISKLRDSITGIASQYTARMSLLAAFGCYVNASADVFSFFLMFTGALMVFKKILDESQGNIISFTTRQEITLVNSFCLVSRYPDYSFNVVKGLSQTLDAYKYFVQEQILLYENGMPVDPEYKKALHDPIFHHDMKELEKFLVRLQNEFYPAIAESNNHYKLQYNYKNDWSIHFVSPSLIFDLACEWFSVYPGDKMSMGSKTNPLKKVLYLFFHALAKCLCHVFTPMKSLLIVDACNITFTKVGMKFSKLSKSNPYNYSPLDSIAINLYKIIRFFENRLVLYGFYMEQSTVLSNKFLLGITGEPPAQWKHRDIVHILPPKLISGEQQVDLFSNNVLSVKNYAFLEEFSRDSEYAQIIQSELNRQNYAIRNEPLAFDYEEGVSNHDFNPSGVIRRLIRSRTEDLSRNGTLPVGVLKSRIENLIESRNEVSRVTNQYAKRS